MLLGINETIEKINQKKLLHIAGNEDLLRKLPKGNWIGGTIEYFMAADGGVVTSEKLFVNELNFADCTIKSYSEVDLNSITKDAYDNGFTILIVPADSEVHKNYAKNAADFDDIFFKNIVGWVAGVNLSKPTQVPGVFDGKTGTYYDNKAVAMHIAIPADKLVEIGIINIFRPDPNSPILEFTEDSFTAENCLIDGKETNFADYLRANNINTQLPLIGDYSGAYINTSFRELSDVTVAFYAPVFRGIKYQFAEAVPDYAQEFRLQIESHNDIEAVFSCNCILNFLYGELEGKKIESFLGPITFGEIAYQLVNQTLVYLCIR